MGLIGDPDLFDNGLVSEVEREKEGGGEQSFQCSGIHDMPYRLASYPGHTPLAPGLGTRLHTQGTHPWPGDEATYPGHIPLAPGLGTRLHTQATHPWPGNEATYPGHTPLAWERGYIPRPHIQSHCMPHSVTVGHRQLLLTTKWYFGTMTCTASREAHSYMYMYMHGFSTYTEATQTV